MKMVTGILKLVSLTLIVILVAILKHLYSYKAFVRLSIGTSKSLKDFVH